MRFSLVLGAVLALVGGTTASKIAGPSDYLSKADAESILSSLALQSDEKEGSVAGSAQGTMRSLTVRAILKENAGVSHEKGDSVSSNCRYLATRLSELGPDAGVKNLVDVSSAYAGASHAATLGKDPACTLRGSADAKRIVRAALTDPKSKLGPLHHAVTALAGGLDAGVSKADLGKVAKRIESLRVESSGKYKGDPSDSKGKTASALHAGRAVEALCMLSKLGAKVDGGAAGAALKTLLSASAKSGAESIWFEDASSDLAATSAVAIALACASRDLGQRSVATDAQTVQLAEFFVGQRHAGNVHAAFHAMKGLASFAQGSPLRTPLVLSIVPGTGASLSSQRSGEKMKILAVDVFGARSSDIQSVDVVRVVRDAPSKGGNAKELVSGGKATRAAGGKAGEFEYDFVKSAKPSLGLHTVTLRGAVAGDAKKKGTSIGVDEADYSVKVTDAASLKEIVVAVSDLGKLAARDTTKHTPRFPKRVTETVRATPFQHLHFGFTCTAGVTPTQAFVRFSPRGASSGSITVVASREAKGKGTYMLNLPMTEAAGDFRHASGKYDVTIIVGHPSFDAPISYDVATVDLEFQVRDEAEEDASEEEARFAPRKEIVHMFRDPAPRPSTPVSFVFACVQVALPFVLLLPLLRASGANLALFPTGGTALLYALGFQASILAFLGLFAAFWIGLNAFSTFYVLVLIVPVAVFTGHGALAHVHKARGGGQ